MSLLMRTLLLNYADTLTVIISKHKLSTYPPPSPQFVAHPHCQQLLTSIWYDGLPGWRKHNFFLKTIICASLICLFPFMAIYYLILPRSKIGQVKANGRTHQLFPKSRMRHGNINALGKKLLFGEKNALLRRIVMRIERTSFILWRAHSH